MIRFPYTFVKKEKFRSLRQKISSLELQIENAKTFIKEIESGNLSVEFDSRLLNVGVDDVLGDSLLSMRDQMNKIAEEEKKRNWTTEGLAKFVNILRDQNHDLNKLGETIVTNIVRYMNANQGSLYILNDSESEPYLELIACYAYDRKKHRSQKIGLGEGLTGQAVLEKSIVYMTNLPKDYLKITSGLGEALPKNLMIVPLTINEKVYGVIELASFSIFQDHHRDFIQRLAESIASTISNVRTNQQTRKLLEETQAQAEQMRSQEEEMRQNMEELSATQEEMQRVMKEVEGKQQYVNQLLNVSTDSIFTIDRTYKLVTWNQGFASTLEKFGMRLEKGLNTLDWYPGEERVKQIALYNRVLSGESFEITAENDQNGIRSHFLSVYAPLKNKDGEVKEAAIFAKDVTAMITAQKKAEQLLAEAQNQSEEMKAQEEELRQNMEELSATQEEIHRVLKEVEAKEAYVSQLLNVSTDSTFTIDKEYKLVSWNKTFAATLEKFGIKLEKGSSTLDWYQGEERAKQIDLYNRVLAGETFEFTSGSDVNGQTSHFLSVYVPLRDGNDEVFEAAIFAKDVTKMIVAQQKAEKLMSEAQQQTEEIKAQEEELRQNMEELTSTQEEIQRILLEVQSKETYLTALINASKDAIFTLDRDYKLISYNEGFSAGLTQMGITLDKGFCILDLFPDAIQKAEQRAHYERAFTGEIFDVTSKFNFNDVVSYYTSSFSPLKNAQDEVFAVAVFGRDVTELLVSKEKAEAKEHYAAELLDASDDMIFTIDRDYKLVSWNKTFAASLEAYGTVLEKGANTLDWYPDAAQKQEQKRIYDRVLSGEGFENSLSSEINGSMYYFKNTHKPLKNEKGEVYEAVIFARDVTASHNDSHTDKNLVHELERREVFMQEAINGCRYEIYIVDRNGKFVTFNESFARKIRAAGVDLKRGADAVSIIPDKKQRESVRKQLERCYKGESFEQIQEFSVNNVTKHIFIHYRPILNGKREVIAAAIYSEDITELMTIKKINKELLQQVRSQN